MVGTDRDEKRRVFEYFDLDAAIKEAAEINGLSYDSSTERAARQFSFTQRRARQLRSEWARAVGYDSAEQYAGWEWVPRRAAPVPQNSRVRRKMTRVDAQTKRMIFDYFEEESAIEEAAEINCLGYKGATVRVAAQRFRLPEQTVGYIKRDWQLQRQGLGGVVAQRKQRVQRMGFKSVREYQDSLARANGFKNYNEYEFQLRHPVPIVFLEKTEKCEQTQRVFDYLDKEAQLREDAHLSGLSYKTPMLTEMAELLDISRDQLKRVMDLWARHHGFDTARAYHNWWAAELGYKTWQHYLHESREKATETTHPRTRRQHQKALHARMAPLLLKQKMPVFEHFDMENAIKEAADINGLRYKSTEMTDVAKTFGLDVATVRYLRHEWRIRQEGYPTSWLRFDAHARSSGLLNGHEARYNASLERGRKKKHDPRDHWHLYENLREFRHIAYRGRRSKTPRDSSGNIYLALVAALESSRGRRVGALRTLLKGRGMKAVVQAARQDAVAPLEAMMLAYTDNKSLGGALSFALENLEEMGYVRCVQPREGYRSARYILTEEGNRLRTRLFEPLPDETTLREPPTQLSFSQQERGEAVGK